VAAPPEPVAEAAPPAPAAVGVQSWYDAGVRLQAAEPEAKVTIRKPEAKQKAADSWSVSEVPGHEAIQAVLDGDADKVASAMLSVWGTADEESKASAETHLAFRESEFKADADALKDALVGTWKLLVTSEKDIVMGAGATGLAGPVYAHVVGHFQTIRKPDPMDIITGSLDFLETSEVAADRKDGKALRAAAKGGFKVEEEGGKLRVSEYYSKSDVAGAQVERLGHSYTCTYVGDGLRVCTLADGARRVYAKVEAEAAGAELARLAALDVPVDPKAKAAWDAEQALQEAIKKKRGEPEDDPNDDRPIWQKRVDDEAKRDGRYNGAQGKPPPTSGGPP